jgi:transposase
MVSKSCSNKKNWLLITNFGWLSDFQNRLLGAWKRVLKVLNLRLRKFNLCWMTSSETKVKSNCHDKNLSILEIWLTNFQDSILKSEKLNWPIQKTSTLWKQIVMVMQPFWKYMCLDSIQFLLIYCYSRK